MKILIYSYNYHPEPIGIAPLMTELAEGLVRRGHQVRVVTGMPNYPQRRIYEGYRGKLYVTEELNGVKIQRCYVWVRPKPGFMDRVLLESSFVSTSFVQALNGWRPDAILLTSPPLPACVPATVVKWIYRCPVVLNLQDVLPEAAIVTGLLRNKFLVRIFESLERFAYRNADRISAIADGFVDNLLKKGVDPQKIALIPNWVDTNFIRPLPKEPNGFRDEYDLNGKFVVLYSGNIALTQGLETLVQAASFLVDVPDIAVVIVGEGRALEVLQRLRERWEATNVKLLPFQPRERLPEMLSAANVGMVMQKSSVIAINMPSKIQVLLASGLPIVASVPEDGTAAKAVRNSGGGLVVPPEDPYALAQAIRELYDNPDRTTALGQQSRQFAIDNYSFEEALRRYEVLFAELVS
ncbi:Glycosyltransferase [Geitlerinema sp. FC II]|nr:glycosyltransferase family 4 protein [Geitlerinema sp. CS-897]PPT08229.1 Glycosyltransferase [Geitlerinema sp. FC II]